MAHTPTHVRAGRSVVVLNGEQFHIENDHGLVVLTHPQWSLVGIGSSLEAASAHLLSEARELAELMARDDIEMLSESAVAMREFAISVK